MSSKEKVGELNIRDRTVFIRDNLPIMRCLNDNCIDLVYLDPPFNKNRKFHGVIGSPAEGTGFKDYWERSDTKDEEIQYVKQKHLKLHQLLETVDGVGVKGSKYYLYYMAVRLIEIHRILKPTGSVYLHCDDTMSHYLKLLMDTIFGVQNYQNEIVWKRASGKSSARRRFDREVDTLFFYSKSDDYFFQSSYKPYTEEFIKKTYRESDSKGRYAQADITGPNVNSKDPEWKGWHPSSIGRSWSLNLLTLDSIMPREEHKKLSTLEKLELLDKHGFIHYSSNKKPSWKKYLHLMQGDKVRNLWDDINNVRGNEDTHYETQKPLKLLDRIIKASSQEGDVVLDPFCGCATTCVSADRLGRKWIGIDIAPAAERLVVSRIKKNQGLWQDIVSRSDLPARTDLGKIPKYNSPENKKKLYGEQGGDCALCEDHFEYRHLVVDHIIPKIDGGQDNLENLQLTCANCNSRKGKKSHAEIKLKIKEERKNIRKH
ncbi:MAG: DNA methyltransferase [Cytophagales bacterium]|nr:DNA methyltransferase [Cytophagales bacterium]